LSEKISEKSPTAQPEKGLSFLLKNFLFKEFKEIKSNGTLFEKVNCLFYKTKFEPVF